MNSIQTQRLLIRPLIMDDLEQAHQLLDVDIQWGGPGIGQEVRRERLSLQIGLANWVDTGKLYGHRALELKEGGTIIGIIQFHPDLWHRNGRQPSGRSSFQATAREEGANTR